jgi:hypothetical protein
MNPTSTNAPNRRMGPEQAEARPSQATRSSSISNDVGPSFSTRPSIPAAARFGLRPALSARSLRSLVSTLRLSAFACQHGGFAAFQLFPVPASPGRGRRTAARGGRDRRLRHRPETTLAESEPEGRSVLTSERSERADKARSAVLTSEGRRPERAKLVS